MGRAKSFGNIYKIMSRAESRLRDSAPLCALTCPCDGPLAPGSSAHGVAFCDHSMTCSLETNQDVVVKSVRG